MGNKQKQLAERSESSYLMREISAEWSFNAGSSFTINAQANVTAKSLNKHLGLSLDNAWRVLKNYKAEEHDDAYVSLKLSYWEIVEDMDMVQKDLSISRGFCLIPKMELYQAMNEIAESVREKFLELLARNGIVLR